MMIRRGDESFTLERASAANWITVERTLQWYHLLPTFVDLSPFECSLSSVMSAIFMISVRLHSQLQQYYDRLFASIVWRQAWKCGTEKCRKHLDYLLTTENYSTKGTQLGTGWNASKSCKVVSDKTSRLKSWTNGTTSCVEGWLNDSHALLTNSVCRV